VSGSIKSLSGNCTVSTLIIDGSDEVNTIDRNDCQLILDLNRFWDTKAIGIIDYNKQLLIE